MEDLERVIVQRGRKELFLKVPVPPSVNSIYYNTKGGGRRLTAKAERYVSDVRALARAFIEDAGWDKQEISKWLYMDMVFYFPDKRIRDSHNCLKILLDALEGVVFENDYSILPRINSVELERTDPHVAIWFTEQKQSERQKHLQKREKMLI